MQTGGYVMDITTILMLNVCKFTNFAFNVVDGYKSPERLSAYQNKYKIPVIPSFFEYFSYIYFFGSSIMGPAFEFVDYIDYINKQNEFKNIPFSGWQTLKQLLFFGVSSLLYLLLSNYVPMS